MTLCKILNQDFFWKYTNFTFYPRSAKIHNISKIIHHKKKKRKNLIYDKNLENKIRQKSFVLQLPLTNSFQNSPTIISSPFNRSITFPLNYSSFQAWNDSREKKRREKKKRERRNNIPNQVLPVLHTLSYKPIHSIHDININREF